MHLTMPAILCRREGGLTAPHPDNAKNTKLRWLRRLREHLGLPRTRELWIWFDIISVPQNDRTLQMKAIGSLCAFTHLSKSRARALRPRGFHPCSRAVTRFIPLVRDADMWERLYGETLEFMSGTLKTYCTRGWCRLELLAALGKCMRIYDRSL